MVSLFSGTPLSLEERNAHNRENRPLVIFSVLLMLLLYALLFTRLYEMVGLPSPRRLAEFLKIAPLLSFEPSGYLVSRIQVTYTHIYSGNFERLLLFPSLALVFLAVYLSPVPFKQPILVAAFLFLMTILYGSRIALGFLCLHLVVYLSFHPTAPHTGRIAFCASFLILPLTFLEVHSSLPRMLEIILFSGAAGLLGGWIYNRRLSPFLAPESANWVRILVAHSVIIMVCGAAILEGLHEPRWHAPVAFLLFFWQWLRLLAYGADYRDGMVPKDLPLSGYLSVFMSPALLPSWGWGIIIAQSYSYQAGGFLAKDKNQLAIAGLRLFGVALLYLVFGKMILEVLLGFLHHHGLVIFPTIPALLHAHLLDHEASASTILFSCLFHEVRWILLFAGIFHFLVALWRIFGYDVAPHINFPFLATNLVSLWARIMFHFRDFIVKVFYYPVFFSLAGKNRWVRVLLATLFAAGCANWLWVHAPEPVISDGISFSHLVGGLQKWPYFLLLGGAISLTEVWLLTKGGKRRPWTPGWRIILDVLAVYLTFQFYALIALFYYANVVDGATLGDYLILFFRGLGLPLT